MVTVPGFKNIFDRQAFYTTVDKALARIKDGASKLAIEEIRAQVSKARADKLKLNLPCILSAASLYRW